MVLLSHNPGRLIPYHRCEEERLRPFPPALINRPKGKRLHRGQDAGVRMPRIPVFEIPENLSLAGGALVSDLGDYLIYNGHHRRWAAVLADVQEVDIAVLQCDEDLWLNDGSEVLRVGSTAIADHQKMVYEQVQKHTLRVLEEERRLLQLHSRRTVYEPPLTLTQSARVALRWPLAWLRGRRRP